MSIGAPVLVPPSFSKRPDGRQIMVYAILVCCAMFGDDGKPAQTTPADLTAYESARDKSGRNATAQVQLALWCEAHGLTAERVKHLAPCRRARPNKRAARGLLGLVAYQGNGRSPSRLSNKFRMTRPSRP